MFIGSRCVDVEVALEVIKVPLGKKEKEMFGFLFK
jgi:hypothetical protein